MSSIGETLRRERIRRSLDLDEISRELKISSRFLEAIEEERFDRLPAGVFAKSFVRQYGTLLGLDGDELAAELQQVLAPVPPVDTNSPGVPPIPEIHVPRVEQWETVSDRRSRDWSSALPAAALVVVVMLVCSGVYAFWQRARHPMTTVAQTTPPSASAQPAPQVQAPAPPQATEPPKPEVQPQTEPGAPINPEPATVAQTPKPAPAPEQATPNNEAARVANPNAPVRVQLTADEPVWVLARADGKYIFSGTLDANQTRSVEGNEAVTLRLGNAGGVHITLNGKPIEVVGPKGQVREIQLTSGGFHIVAAPKPSLPLDNPI
jgi:cytoskeleton protein RodZ